ncbi:MAG: restriction endonuclease subunit S, partial [Bryobacterales bacterium]|nr:restriction endonuclease subunit S [Bryobacterales bacterium]
CGGRAALNQHLFRVTSDRYPKWFYLHSLLSHLPAFRQIAQDKATTMGHIRRHHLTEALCVSPPDGVIAELSDTFLCLLDRQLATELSSRTLATLRDTLLPKLISGEIRLDCSTDWAVTVG